MILSKVGPNYLIVAAGLTFTLLACSGLQSLSAPTATPVSTPTETSVPLTGTLRPSATPMPPTSTPPPSETPAPSLTPTLSSTLTPSLTPSPRPTRTATPAPAWVTDFAQPILDAIALRPPNFQDDFDDQSGGWQIESWCALGG
jgi:hypothetical protein